MKSVFVYLFALSIYIQPVTALAVDYLELDSHCLMLWQHELKLIKEEVEEGELTEAEAQADIDQMISMEEQCVCLYRNILEGTGSDFVLYLQKVDIIQMNDNYTDEEVGKLDVPKYPESLDIDALIEDSMTACGIDME